MQQKDDVVIHIVFFFLCITKEQVKTYSFAQLLGGGFNMKFFELIFSISVIC